MDEVVGTVLATFRQELSQCLESGAWTLESDVRDAFVNALVSVGGTQSQIQREAPHVTLPRSYGWIDLLVWDVPVGSQCAIEFKYDRGIPSGYNQPKTQKAGAIFADFIRRLHWPTSDQRLFVYATDSEMRNYLTASPTILSRVLQEAPGASIDLDSTSFRDLPKTITQRVTA